MKRLLCIVGSMDVGGAETFLMKVYRSLDKTKYQMDFCVGKKEKGFYDDEIINLGGKIYHITPKTKGAWKNFNDIRKIVKNNKYENVLRISQNSISSLELLAAKLGGAKNLIFRSSNSSVYGSKKEALVHKIFRPFANLISTQKIAPSKEAGDFMFGKAKFTIINNGLPIDEYKFSEESRSHYRKLFGAEKNTMVIGHVGRFNKQKNHKFLIDVFDEYHAKNQNSVLWLLGDGESKDEIKGYVKEKNLTKFVKFLGIRKDVNKIYSAMDCFVFPSLFEGMPNTVIEAQVSGLPCVISNTITQSCSIDKNITFFHPLKNTNIWTEQINAATAKQRESKPTHIFENYNVTDVANNCTKIFFR